MKKFINYVTLSVFGTLGVSCYILADTFFISKGLGANGLTALNLAFFSSGRGNDSSFWNFYLF